MSEAERTIFLPMVLQSTAIGRVLVRKGVLSKSDLLAELDEMMIKSGSSHEIAEAIDVAKSGVATW